MQRQSRNRRSWRAAGALVVAAGLALVSTAAPAVVISVDTLEDSVTSNGNCSLREAVIAANTNVAVDDCPAGTAVGTDNIWVLLNGTIHVNSQLPLLEKVTILGLGRDVTTISGQGASPVFLVDMPDTTHDVTISNLAIADGLNNFLMPGAGVSVARVGTLRVEHCRFQGNTAADIGGAIGTRLTGTTSSLDVIQCEFIDNSTQRGGAIGVDTTPPYAAPASVEIEASSFIGNHAPTGGALNLLNVRSVYIDRSRFHDNDALVPDNFLDGQGGAIHWDCVPESGCFISLPQIAGMMQIRNSSFTDNIAGVGGAVHIARGEIARIINSTFSGNLATHHPAGSALYVENGIVRLFHDTFIGNAYPADAHTNDSVLHAGSGGSIQMASSIVWSEDSGTGPACETSLDGVYESLGYNIDAGDSCSGAGTDHSNVADPGLFKLDDYGDNTGAVLLETFLPRPGGLAIDGGPSGSSCDGANVSLITDQRGEARPVNGDGSGSTECDIGAVEYQPGLDPVARTLELVTSGAGHGTVVDASGDELCGSTTSPCSRQVPDGSEITLTATATSGHVFVGWFGDCAASGTGPCTLTMDQYHGAGAEFQPAAEPATLTVGKNLGPVGIDATVTSAPSGINCGATCSANFEVDDVIVLTATPLPGTVVSGWSGCDSVSGDGLQCTITLTGDSNVGVTLAAQGASIFADGFEG